MASSSVIPVPSSLLDERRKQALGTIQYELNHGLALNIASKELAVLSDFFGTYHAVRRVIVERLNGSFSSAEGKAFLDMYAVSIATAAVAEERGIDLTLSARAAPIDFERPYRPSLRNADLFSKAFKEYLGELHRDGDSSTRLLSSFAAAAMNGAEGETYNELRNLCSGYEVEVGGKRYAAFGRRPFVQRLEVVVEEEIVGNEEAKRALERAANWLGEYCRDGVRLEDLVEQPRTINLFGPPGTGKTSTIRSVYAWAQREIGPEMAVPFELIQMSNSIKTKYYGESAKQVEKVFDMIAKGESAYFLVIDDVDKIFMGNSGADSSTEERAVLETLLRRLEGLVASDKGNYILITTSNNPLDINDALDQRLSQRAIYVPGPRDAAECAAILSLKLRKAIRSEYLSCPSLDEMGALIHRRGLNGRDIRNAAQTIYDHFVDAAAAGHRRFRGIDLRRALDDGLLLTEEMLRSGIEEVAAKKEEKRALQHRAQVERRLAALLIEQEARALLESGSSRRGSLPGNV